VNGPRLVLNASLAGLYGAVLLAAALAVLHPAAGQPSAWPGLAAVVVIYAVAAGVVWPLLYSLVRFFASRRLQVQAPSLRYIMSFHVANTAVVLIALGILLATYRRCIDVAATLRLRFLVGAVAVAWVYGAFVCVMPRLKRSTPVQASAAGIALAALVAPLLVSLPGAEPGTRVAPATDGAIDLPAPSGRVVLLAFDGADLEDVLRLLATGRLTLLGRLRREGTMGRLQGSPPGDTAVERAVLVTGQLPFHNGVRGPWSRDLLGRATGLMVVPPGLWFDGLVAPVMRRRVVTIADRRVPAVWDLAERAGGRALAGGWEVDLDLEGPAPSIGEARRRTIAAEFLESDAAAADDPDTAGLLDELARALDADAAAARTLDAAAATPGAGLIAVNFPGLDRVAHLFLRAARPEAFGDVGEAEREQFAEALPRYYERIEAIVGRGLAIAGPDGWLFVVSAHGMDAAPLGRRLVSLAGGPPMPGSHAEAPAGLLLARGPSIRTGAAIGRAPATEVVPTILHLLGLPIARDLDGSIMEAALEEGAVLDRPAVMIDSYGAWP
jgi:type I phosphodiesterase/nucleotide pyrophosphatase